MKSNLFISIITVVLNQAEDLETTINSVISQTYNQYEYIIIDGNSKDGTLEVINRYNNYIDIWKSEPDKGIYDAMNKGVNLSTGEYILFLNAGDYFYNENVLQKLVTSYDIVKYDLVYGSVCKIYNNYTIKSQPTLLDIKTGKMPPHQASFFSKSSFNNLGGFSLKYSSSSDYEFYVRYFELGYPTLKVNQTIAYFIPGGMSSNKSISTYETYQIIKQYFGKYQSSLFYLKKVIIEQCIKSILLKLRLQSIYNILARLNNKFQSI